MTTASGSFVISLQQNDAFARLSGDYNPLHVDPVYARRLQFGHPVIHGVHHLLRAWGEALKRLPPATGKLVTKVSAGFQSPAQVDKTIDFQSAVSGEDRFELSASSEGKQILSLVVTLADAAEAAGAPPPCAQLETGFPPREAPLEQDFPPSQAEGELPLHFDLETARDLFPQLVDLLSPCRFAQILATTRIVGMRSPGLHSIYSRMRLDFLPDEGADTRSTMRYSQRRADARVQLLKIGLESDALSGELDTFFRPKPVTQPDYSTVRTHVDKPIFAGQRALVVGGSRGVGEVTAKILAAGGADVVITYNRGGEEAQAVADDINQGGGKCTTVPLNVLALESWPETLSPPSHVYYFASPHIDGNRSAQWNAELFERFCSFYLTGFSALVALCMERSANDTPVNFYYPSSVYIDAPERGFAEYTVAKAAGEALCAQLASRFKEARFDTPRLPRMATDQTAGIIPIKCESVLDVMLRELGVPGSA